MNRTKVLSIVGPGRSGTTVLAAVLGEAEGVVDVGELRWLYRRGLLERRSCGCGLPPDECPVWSAVLARLLADGTETPAEFGARVAAGQAVQQSRRQRIRVIRRAARGVDWPPLALVRAVTAQLVPAIADVTGARVIVDSSKRAQDAAVLAGLPEVDHYVLHIVRDPAAVAFSWGRRDKTVRVAGGERSMETRGLLSSMARWVESAVGAAALRREVPPERWLFLRYEDFAAHPRAAIAGVLDLLGETTAPPFVDDDTVVLHVNHTVAGNPNRFRVGPIRIALDAEWAARMPRHRRAAVRALLWPLLLRYGYPVLGSGPRATERSVSRSDASTSERSA